MTIIVGIKCRDGLVLASDSQTTYGTSKRLDTKKISLVHFEDGAALVAESGPASMSGEALRLLQKKATTQKISTDDSPALLAVDAMRELRKGQSALYPGRHSLDEWKKFYTTEGRTELAVAYWFGGKVELYTITLDECVPSKVQGHFAAAGCGGDLAEYLLGEFCPKGLTCSLAAVVASYVVEMVKQHDACCGGPTGIGMITENPPDLKALIDAKEEIMTPPECRRFRNYTVGLLPQPTVDEFMKEVLAVQGQIQDKFNALTVQGFKEAANRLSQKLADAFKDFGDRIPEGE
jgi:20S proteasome alpha/beta subunit